MKKSLLQTGLLLCALCAMHGWTAAQAPDGETKPNGLRVNSKSVVTIYGDHLGQPNPLAKYSLDDIYYFKIHGDQVVGCDESPLKGIAFTKIMIPGNKGHDQDLQVAVNEAKQYIDANNLGPKAGNTNCPPTFPLINSVEMQVDTNQLGMTFWIPTSVLTDSNTVTGKVEYKDADLETFDPTYIRSRWFGAVLAVPFKYRIAKSKSSLTAESTIGASIGWTFHRDHNFDNRFWLMGAGGLTVINPNSAFDDPGTAKEKNIPGATACFGIGANINKTQAGIVVGMDFADPDWEYHGKPWVSFSVGFEFLKPDAKNDATNK